MRELDEILKTRKKMRDIEIRIYELREIVRQPKSQIISDMPRGGDRKNTIEEYIVKLERLESKLHSLQKYIDEVWIGVEHIFDDCDIPIMHRKLMAFRFYDGNQWRKCVKLMAEKYHGVKWNENKLFRIYRNVLVKVNKTTKQSL